MDCNEVLTPVEYWVIISRESYATVNESDIAGVREDDVWVILTDVVQP